MLLTKALPLITAVLLKFIIAPVVVLVPAVNKNIELLIVLDDVAFEVLPISINAFTDADVDA